MPRKTRLKSPANLIPIHTWEDADQHLRRLGDLRQSIYSRQADADRRLDAIKAELKAGVEPLTGEVQQILQSLEAFAVARRDEFKTKSRRLNFGTIGWRSSTAIRVKKTTLDLIKSVLSASKRKGCINIKETVSKDGLAKLTDEELAGVDARRERKEAFFAEPTETEIQTTE